MKLRRSYVIFVVFFFAFFFIFNTVNPMPVKASSAYYVSASGNDNNPGTISQPFKTIQKGIDSATSPGDTVYVRAGNYTEIVNMTHSGTAGSPITLQGYGNERPVIDLSDTGPGQWAAVVNMLASYIVFKQFEVANSTGYAVCSHPTDDQGYHDITVRDVWMHHLVEGGFFTRYADNVIIEDCKIWNHNRANDPDSGFFTEFSWCGSITTHSGDNFTIRRNTIYDGYGEGMNIWGSCTNVLIEDNVLYDNFGPNIYVVNSSNVTVQRNLVYSTEDLEHGRGGNPGSGIVLSEEGPASGATGGMTNPPESYLHDVKVINNFVMGCSQNMGIWFDPTFIGHQGLINVLVANNTFVDAHVNSYNNWYSSIFVQDTAGNVVNSSIINNIFLQDDTSCPIVSSTWQQTTGITWGNNIFSYIPSLHARGIGDIYGGNLGVSRNGTFAKGQLTGDYFKLLSNSPAINAGRAVPGVTADYFNTARDSSLDMGGYEYASGGPTPTQTPASTPTPTPTSVSVTVNDNTTGTGNNQYEYVGTWAYGSAAGSYTDDLHWSNTTNDYYQVRFNGTQIRLYSPKDAWHGIGAVSIDGGSETDVDFYSAGRQDQALLYTSPALSAGRHILKIRVKGTKNAGSTGYYVLADKVEITSGGEVPTPTPTPTPAINLITNPGFESGNTGWTLWPSTSVVANNAHSGSSSLRIADQSGCEQYITSGVQASVQYNFEAWGKVARSGQIGQIFIECKNSSDQTLQQFQLSNFTATSYEKHNITFTAPSGTTKLKVWTWGNGNYFYVDDFTLRQN